MFRLISIVLLILLGTPCLVGFAQPKMVLVDTEKRVANAKARPDLVAQLDKVAKLKIAARKETFHLGEMIGLDLALLNSSSKPIYFLEGFQPRIYVQNVSGDSNWIQPYGVADRTVVPESFGLLAPSEFIHQTFQLLAGCE